MSKKLTQRERVVQTLLDVGRGLFHPDGYILVKDGHRWLSTRYFKQVLLVSECNGRISEARADGYDIATLESEKDAYGFAYHRLVSAPKRKVTTYVPTMRNGKMVAVATTMLI